MKDQYRFLISGVRNSNGDCIYGSDWAIDDFYDLEDCRLSCSFIGHTPIFSSNLVGSDKIFPAREFVRNFVGKMNRKGQEFDINGLVEGLDKL